MASRVKLIMAVLTGGLVAVLSLMLLTVGLFGYDECDRLITEGTTVRSRSLPWPAGGVECTYLLPSGRTIIESPGWAPLSFILVSASLPIGFAAAVIIVKRRRKPSSSSLEPSRSAGRS